MKNYLRKSIIICVDLLSLIGLFYITCDILQPNEMYLKDFLFVIIIIFILFIYEKIYALEYDFWQETYKILKSFILAYIIVMALLAFLKTSQNYSKFFISGYFFISLFVMPILKRFEKNILYSFDYFKKNVLLVGDTTQTELLKNELQKNWYLGMKVNDKVYDMVIISSKGMSLHVIDQTIAKYLDKKSAVYVIPYVTNIDFANSVIMDYSNIRLNTIQIENRLLLKRNIYVKYIFDYILALTALPIFFAIHFLISIAISLESNGTVFFKQYRLGKDNKHFICYKYRTMHENSDDILQRYLSKYPQEVQYYEEYHKYKNDPRITKIGKFLRASSLDELPQIINILKGEMSFVGPRPYMLEESEKLGEHKHFILKVKPGITGLWQVSGRNNLTFKQRNELEVWYIKNWSLWIDLVILVKTLKVVVNKVGAQ